MKENKQKTSIGWKVLSGILAAALITVSCLYGFGVGTSNAKNVNGNTAAITATSQSNSGNNSANALSLWNDGAKLKAQLTDYIKAVTTAGSKDFIPVENRIAVFDFDGTLFCETDPVYFDYRLFYHRVTEDASYKDKATDTEKETAAKIKTMMETGESAKGLETDHGKGVASAFSGMTVDEFYAYVKDFRNQPMTSYNNMKNGEAFYKPMLQVVDYLQDNGFTVYIVSGTDRLIVRGVVEDSEMKLPARQIIGSDETLVSDHQNGEDGLTYQYTNKDKLILGGDFLIKNLKMNKVSVIEKEIGQQPVLSFGNSSGDSSMANFVITNNKYKSAAYMLCCDDLKRENGNTEKAEKMKKSCEENGWTAISMKDDWKTIYGDSVTKK